MLRSKDSVDARFLERGNDAKASAAVKRVGIAPGSFMIAFVPHGTRVLYSGRWSSSASASDAMGEAVQPSRAARLADGGVAATARLPGYCSRARRWHAWLRPRFAKCKARPARRVRRLVMPSIVDGINVINGSPALAAADVSLAESFGAKATYFNADCILLSKQTSSSSMD